MSRIRLSEKDFQIFRGSMLRLHVPLQRVMASLSTNHT